MEKILSACLEKARKSAESAELALAAPLVSSIVQIAELAQQRKGVFTVIVTSLLKKISDPAQDVRRHQTQIPGGYSGRGLDTAHVTPFLRRNALPYMAESGWLTRSLEQDHPYDQNFPGKISPKSLRVAFLEIFEALEMQGQNPEAILTRLFREIIARQPAAIAPTLHDDTNAWISRNDLVRIWTQHFTAGYAGTHGAARLPVLALFSILQNITLASPSGQLLKLLPLKSHTSPDARSGAIGDIEIVGLKELYAIGVEVKFDIAPTFNLLEPLKEKFSNRHVDQIWWVTTAEFPDLSEQISEFQADLLLNGGIDLSVITFRDMAKGMLLLAADVDKVVSDYSDYLDHDPVVGEIHRQSWVELITPFLE